MEESVAGAVIGLVMSPIVLLIVYVSIKAAATGQLDRNGMVGIRTRATRRSDVAWRAAHAAALPLSRTVMVATLGVDLLVVVALFTGPQWFRPWAGVVPALALLAGLVPIVVTANHAARAADNS